MDGIAGSDTPRTASSDAPSSGVDEARIPVAFARVLAGAGVATPVSSVTSFTEALGAVGLGRREHVYWAARTTLVRKPEDIEPFDRAFAVFFDGRDGSADAANPPPATVQLLVDVDDDELPDTDEQQPGSDDESIVLRFSTSEVLRHRDFADYSDVELAEARRWMSRLRVVGSPRQSLRLTPTRRRTRRPDLRRTIRAAVRTRGDPLQRHYRRPAVRRRRIVLLLDVSGSMEPYARALMLFVQAAVSGRRRIEAFTMGTRLTRVTRELDAHDPDVAMRRAATSVQDWSGGTRLGDGIAAFNTEWGARGMARGADVVILSDGWDRGDPQFLAAEMERLQRLSHRVIWVNPLKVTPGYAPLARGMAAALPHIDAFIEGHSLDALERLTEVLNA